MHCSQRTTLRSRPPEGARAPVAREGPGGPGEGTCPILGAHPVMATAYGFIAHQTWGHCDPHSAPIPQQFRGVPSGPALAKPTSMNSRTLCALALALASTSVACAVDSGNGEASADQTSRRTSIQRKLSPEVAIPSATPIGRTMDAVTAELSQGLRALEPRQNGDCVTRSFVGADGRETFQRQTCASFDVIRVGYRGPNDIDRVYGDHAKGTTAKDGRVDSYSQKTGDYLSVEDQNRDGKADLQIFKAAPGTDLAPFGPYRLTVDGKLANRILEDNDFNGRFELESLTAEAASNSWFLKDE